MIWGFLYLHIIYFSQSYSSCWKCLNIRDILLSSSVNKFTRCLIQGEIFIKVDMSDEGFLIKMQNVIIYHIKGYKVKNEIYLFCKD